MTIQDLGALGELVGAIAVVISIVYLAIQIRSNTKATQASASFDATHSWATFNEGTIDWPDDLYDAVIKSFDRTVPLENFTEIQIGRLGVQFRALFQKLEGQYFLYQHGYLEPELWEKRRTWARGLIDLPFYKQWWELELEQAIYTDSFIAAVESADSIEVVISGLRRS